MTMQAEALAANKPVICGEADASLSTALMHGVALHMTCLGLDRVVLNKIESILCLCTFWCRAGCLPC
jgi:hypothetical protein